MSTAPLSRDEQIDFIKNARARRDAAFERWSNDETVKELFRSPAEHVEEDVSYTHSEVLTRRYG